MKKRRILSLILALTMCASSAFAFGCRGGGGWDVDETKVQVYVGPYNGGWGSDFVEVWKTAYEEMHKDTVYQTPDGEKVGVEIKYSVDGSYGGQLATTTSSVHDIILAEVVDYRDLVSNGDLVDVSSWVSEVNPYDGKTIKSKMTDDQISFFTDDSKIKMEAQKQEEINKNGSSSINPYDQFYAVPSYQATYNMYYDRQ
ncbi:MAG: hypothetical protein J6Q32_05415, partial [Clostridia bacterium]|nr:hypothetical protein [Clostridia bacterium]